MVFHVSSWLVSQGSLSRHVSCLMSHDCVLTLSLSDIAMCFFCAETLAFLAEGRPRGPLTRCLLTYCKGIVLVVAVLWLYVFS